MTSFLTPSLSRRAVLQSAAVGAIGISPALRATVYAQGSDLIVTATVRRSELTDLFRTLSWRTRGKRCPRLSVPRAP